MTNRQQVLAVLGMASLPLDDDELSRRTGITPRQSINQICRQLAIEGIIVRARGRGGKYVNSLAHQLRSEADGNESDSVPEPMNSPGSAREQGAAEVVMIEILGRHLGLALAPRRIVHPSGARVEIDGADPGLSILVECWAHQGTAKVAQKNKLINDAVKLWWVSRSLTPSPARLVLCVSDELAVQHLRGRSWQAQAIA